MKKILLVLTLALCASITFAQTVPSYVPTYGLVGYWPFNGNANDESGNGNNGTVNGATLADDRFGNSNGAFSFDGLNDYINIPNSISLNFGSILNFSVSFFYQPINQNSFSGLISKMYPSRPSVGPRVGWQISQENLKIGLQSRSGNSLNQFENYPCGEGQLTPISPNKFNHCVIVFDRINGKIKFYVDNVLIRTDSCVEIIENVSNVEPLLIGVDREEWFYSSGKLDDIAIYNRALTQEEIAALYQGCLLSVTTQPTNQTTNISNNAQFTVVSSDPDATYQWQTDLGVGFQNISNAGQYSGATNNTLTIANTTLSNNNQLFRCVIAKASCTDTSSVATLNVNEAIPSNVPTDGLVGYWPFNGNANDESGNGNNGTVNGATLTTDRNGNALSAYSFNGQNCDLQKITTPNIIDNLNAYSVSVWYKSDDVLKGAQTILNSFPHTYIGVTLSYCSQTTMCSFVGNGGSGWVIMGFSNSWEINNDNSWHNLTIVKTTADIKYYIDGLLKKTTVITHNLNVGSFVMNFGSSSINGGIDCYETFKGSIDDIAQYNRALTPEEIVGLYNAQAAGCETLVINSGTLSFNPLVYASTVTIYPNPANDHITIDCGNLANVSGWSIKIFNTLGQEVFSGAMNTQQYVVPLNTWSGQGVYFVKIYDASGNLMNTKKIILQ